MSRLVDPAASLNRHTARSDLKLYGITAVQPQAPGIYRALIAHYVPTSLALTTIENQTGGRLSPYNVSRAW